MDQPAEITGVVVRGVRLFLNSVLLLKRDHVRFGRGPTDAANDFQDLEIDEDAFGYESGEDANFFDGEDIAPF